MISQRKQSILAATIQQYIETGEPVASKTVLGSINLDLSPATIRHELNELEQAGYLTHLHTSSGRVPTDFGYRFFVDALMYQQPIAQTDLQSVSTYLRQLGSDMNTTLETLTKIVSEVVNCTTLVLIPNVVQETLKLVHLLAMDMNRVLVVILSSLGINHEFLVTLKGAVHPDDLVKMSEALNHHFSNGAIQELDPQFLPNWLSQFYSTQESIKELYSQIAMMTQSLKLKQQRLFSHGVSKMMAMPEFRDVNSIRNVVGLLEENRLLIQLLSAFLTHSGPNVVIGHESRVDQLEDCSLVMAPFDVDTKTRGMIGVLGPKRMNYSRIVPIVQQVTQMANQFFNRLFKGGEK